MGSTTIRIKYDGKDTDRSVGNDGKTLQESNVAVLWVNEHEASVTIYGEDQSPEVIQFNAKGSPPFIVVEAELE